MICLGCDCPKERCDGYGYGRKCCPDCDHRQPGLHRIGPNPWDFEFKPEVGQRMKFVGVNGQEFEGTVTDFEENRETGELNMTMAQFPDIAAWGYSALEDGQ